MPNFEPNILDDIGRIYRRLEALEKAPQLPSSSIGSGGLVVKDGGSIDVESPGEFLLDGVPIGDRVALPIVGNKFDVETTWPNDQYRTVASVVLAVPSWATTVHVLGFANFSGLNLSGTSLATFCRTVIAGQAGSEMRTTCENNTRRVVSSTHARTISSPAATVTVSAQGKFNIGDPDVSTAEATVSALLIASA